MTGSPVAKLPFKPSIAIVVGPTASGKTDLALRLAERCDAEIVNADSMQVYRGMDIGTAKPSREELQRIPHHLIDVVGPDRNFSASDFRVHAEEAIRDSVDRGKNVIVVGGTGLYIKALLQGLVDSPSGKDEIRRELAELSAREGKEAILARLRAVDPDTAARLHPNDQVRIIRALEVYHETGRPISAYRDDHGFGGDFYRSLKIGIHVERDELYRRIERRVDQMLSNGLVSEVERLLAAGYGAGLKSMRSIGYRHVCSLIRKEYSYDEMVRLIKRDTRRYAKRQLTWFRTDEEINWVEYPGNFDTICSIVIEFFLSKGEDHAESAI